jgi:phage virion morphogenesis protein
VIQIQITDNSATPWLIKAVEAIDKPRALLDAVGAALVASTKMRFVDGKGPNGEPWAAVLRGGQPLRNTGVHLMNAVSHRVENNADGWSVTVGVPYAWAAVHQFGATINAKSAPWLRFKVGDRWARKKSVTIPARPFLGLGPDDRREIAGIISSALRPGSP